MTISTAAICLQAGAAAPNGTVGDAETVKGELLPRCDPGTGFTCPTGVQLHRAMTPLMGI